MVSYIPINLNSDRVEYSKRFEKALDYVFRNTFSHINAHVIYDFVSPTGIIGEYAFLLFIDVPFKTSEGRTNYCKWNGKNFVNTIAIAVRRIDMPDVVDIDEECFYTEKGSFNYVEEIESDKQQLRNYVFNRMPDIRHFDVSVIYNVSAPNCSKQFYYNNISFNRGIPLSSVISYAVEQQKNMYGRVNALLLNDSQKSATWSSFVNLFIETAEKDTNQGILTKRKVDSITNRKLSKAVEEVIANVGNNLCIIKGGPGTGKTHTLLRLMYNQIRKHETQNSHHCRLLTYNNLLVADLKQILKGIGDFTPTNASITTLHKFFFDIYKNSPVRQLNLDQKEIDNYFGLCLSRIAKFNALLDLEHNQTGIDDLRELFRKVFDRGNIVLSEKREYESYRAHVLNRKIEPSLALIEEYAIEYVKKKRDAYLNTYHNQRFLNGYNAILKQLYLMYHDQEAFRREHHLQTAYVIDDIRETDEYKSKYQSLYLRFLKNAKQRFLYKDIRVEDVVSDFHKELRDLDAEMEQGIKNKTEEDNRKEFQDQLKKIKRKVNWSGLILVDEAQDCQQYEKALLLELNGSDDTVIATGGASQLIRTPVPNDWSVCLGKRLSHKIIKLKDVRKKDISHRQKGNLVRFINMFSKQYEIDEALSVSDDMNNEGRVIIDCRKSTDLPIDAINAMYLSGKDYGCSNYENLLFLFPHNYVERDNMKENYVVIDTFGFIDVRPSFGNRQLSELKFPKYLNIVDGTVNDKRNLQIGQDSTRCILYESCRGIESWNVICIDFDKFYEEKQVSRDSADYANQNKELFVSADELRAKYAAIWCYMAMTRAIDTLYIKLSNPYSHFSSSLIDIANQLSFVEVIRK